MVAAKISPKFLDCPRLQTSGWKGSKVWSRFCSKRSKIVSSYFGREQHIAERFELCCQSNWLFWFQKASNTLINACQETLRKYHKEGPLADIHGGPICLRMCGQVKVRFCVQLRLRITPPPLRVASLGTHCERLQNALEKDRGLMIHFVFDATNTMLHTPQALRKA